MPTVAEQLREAREAQRLTVYQVADVTKIRTDHIRALEIGDYDIFSAPIYIKGFVRAYASLLRLDVPAVMADLDHELSRSDKHSEPPPLTDEPRGPLDVLTLQLSRVRWRVALPALAIIVIALVLAISWRTWRHQQGTDPLATLGPGLHETTAANGDTLPLPAPPPAPE